MFEKNIVKVICKRIFPLLILLCLLTIASFADEPLFRSEEIFHPEIAKKGMVVSDDMLATMAGLKVLEEGGNAIDAAVTVGFVLAVTFPEAGNIGGGGFMLVRNGVTGEIVAIDYREKAPAAASKDMFLDKDGNVDREKSRDSIQSSGVPGTVAGLTLALRKYGTISLERALKPAIELAKNGYPVSYSLWKSLRGAKHRMAKSKSSMAVFFGHKEKPPEVGTELKQPELARTLKLISEKGAYAFYKGQVSEKIAKFMKDSGGIITKEDLASYEPVIRKPVEGTYRGYRIYSMPPPSSGGVHLIQMLNILEHFDINEYGSNTADEIQVLTETMKLAYADRSKYLGDPDFVDVPVKQLVSKIYAEKLVKKVNLKKATPSSKIKPGNPYIMNESDETTHFSVMDREGNVVSNTYTLNFSYGNGITVPGTGILLNNEMNDFSAKSGVPNAYGLVGGEYNSIKPGKRMLSSMTPTIVLRDGKPFIATGSPGGSRIITTVLQVLLNTIDHDMNIATATATPRIHHQWLPDITYVEKGISKDTLSILRERGHNIESGRTMGCVNSILFSDGYFYGYTDSRRAGGLAAGFN